MNASTPERRAVVALTAGTGQPSTTRMLSDLLVRSTTHALTSAGVEAATRTIELATLAGPISQALTTGNVPDSLTAVLQTLAAADAVIAVSPVYKAGLSGLFKSFIDILDNDLLIATPMALAATGGSSRHASVVDDQMRPLFAFMRAIPAPTSVFAAPEDWNDPALVRRAERAGAELAALVTSGVRDRITNDSWNQYRHEFATNARPATGSEALNLDTDLMRLAAGGPASPRRA